jgi:DNA (cytosine-5)-methyltransferase 1
MAALQGFPNDFELGGAAVSNLYRHIGDAVPPLVSFQIAHLCHWILSGNKPHIDSLLLGGTHLHINDLVRTREPIAANA